MARTKNSPFKFNLLPPKSEYEIELEAERDDSLLYALILVFFGFVVYGAVLLAQLFVMQPRIEELEDVVITKEGQTESFAQIRAQYGELFIKTLTLDPLLTKDLNPQDIFRITEVVNSFNPNLGVVNYAREESGEFVFEILSPSIDLIPGLNQALENADFIESTFVRAVDVGQSSGIVRIITGITLDGGQS